MTKAPKAKPKPQPKPSTPSRKDYAEKLYGK